MYQAKSGVISISLYQQSPPPPKKKNSQSELKHISLSEQKKTSDTEYQAKGLFALDDNLKVGSMDNNCISYFCLCCQVWTGPLVTVQPISDDIKSSHRCRQVRTTP